jgi:hypothetical protein
MLSKERDAQWQGAMAQPGPLESFPAYADHPFGSDSFHCTGTVAQRDDALSAAPKMSRFQLIRASVMF